MDTFHAVSPIDFHGLAKSFVTGLKYIITGCNIR